MGKNYENKRKVVNELREESERIRNDQSALKSEFSLLGSINSLLSEFDDEVVESVANVEDVGEQEDARLENEHQENDAGKDRIVGEIDDELDKLRSGMDSLDAMSDNPFGQKSVEQAKREYREQSEKYRKLIDELDVEGEKERDKPTSTSEGAAAQGFESVKENDASLEKSDSMVNVNSNGGFSLGNGMGESLLAASNDNPQRDINNAFEFSNINYDKSSVHWQENANREVESLGEQIDKLSLKIDFVEQQRKDVYSQIAGYINTNHLTPEMAKLDVNYRIMSENYIQLNQRYEDYKSKRNILEARRDSIALDIDPSMKTTFVGRNKANFKESYNGIITDPQGHTVPGYGGTCGINHECSVVNQQTGRSLDEAYGINYAVSHGLCETGGSYAENGGTSAENRRDFLIDHGVSFSRFSGGRGTGDELSLDDLAKKFNSGESAGLMLKAQDLSQPDIDHESRRWILNDPKHNRARFYANHATTIVGFSYGSDGKVTGVWINDTGNWAGSNRVFIDRDKFNKMQKNTEGFSVEFSRRI